MNSVTQFPVEQTLELPRQHNPREFQHMALEGLSPARQKEMIMDAHAAGLVSDQDTGVLIDAYGLKEA